MRGKKIESFTQMGLQLVQPIQWWGLDACLESLPAAHKGLLAAPNTHRLSRRADMWRQQYIYYLRTHEQLHEDKVGKWDNIVPKARSNLQTTTVRDLH